MQRIQDLKVWQRSHRLVVEVYRLTGNFPDGERYGLVSQLRRAAVSVPTNIAEGSKREHRPEYARFLNIAEGSLAETEYLVMLSRDLGLIPGRAAAKSDCEAGEIARMLCALRQKVEDTATSHSRAV